MGVWMNTCLYSIVYLLAIVVNICEIQLISFKLNVCWKCAVLVWMITISNGCLLRQQAVGIAFALISLSRFIAHFAPFRTVFASETSIFHTEL